MNRTWHFFSAISLFTAIAAQTATLDGGSWFEPLGAAQSCHMDPGMPCPEIQLGPDPAERALNARGYSQLDLRQGQGQKWEWSEGQARTTYAQMDFRFLLATPMSTMVGFALYSPWPGQEWRREDTRMFQEQPSSYVALLLGGDLLGFLEDSQQKLIASVEIPIAYEPGIWKGSLSYLPTENHRLRLEYARVESREEISHWISDDGGFKLKYTEQRAQLQLAGRFTYGPEWAFGVRRSWLEPRSGHESLERLGSIWGTDGQLIWLGKRWSWRNDFSAEYRKLEDRYTHSVSHAHLHAEQASDLYRYRSRLQRTFAESWRVGMQVERRLVKGAPSLLQTDAGNDSLDWIAALQLPFSKLSSQRLLTDLYGGDLRKWFSGIYFEAGGDYALSRWSGSSSPLQTWGAGLPLNGAAAAEHAILRLGAGFQTGETLYRYTFSQAFALHNDGANITNNGHHRFEISGSF